MFWIILIAFLWISFGLWCCVKVGSQADDRYDWLFKQRYGYKDDKLK